MTPADRLLQQWRARRAAKYLPRGGRILDIGAAGEGLLRGLGARESIGIDPMLAADSSHEFGRLIKGSFPDDLPPGTPFDAIALLAVLEHIPSALQAPFTEQCFVRLRPGGVVVASVPSRHVDALLAVLLRLRLVDGMSLEQHYGFDARETRPLFEGAGFRMVRHERFELWLNHLFVFKRD